MKKMITLLSLLSTLSTGAFADNKMAPFENMPDSEVCESSKLSVGAAMGNGNTDSAVIEYKIINRGLENQYLEFKEGNSIFKIGNGFVGNDSQRNLEVTKCGFVTSRGETYYLCDLLDAEPTFRDVLRNGNGGFLVGASPTEICSRSNCYKLKSCK